MILKIWKKGKLKCEMIWKIWKKGTSRIVKRFEIVKIQKKIVKRYEKYGRKVFSFYKQLILPVIYLSLHYALQ
jgi:transcription elongation factor GreA-like protein